MGFFKLNRWKIFGKLCLNILFWSTFGFVYYLSVRQNQNIPDKSGEVRVMWYVMLGMSMGSFTIYFLAGWYAFYKARRLLSSVLYPNLFDDNRFTEEYLYKNVWLLYTTECAYGQVLGYPTIASVDIFRGKTPSTRIEFHVFIRKLNKTRKQTLSILVENSTIPRNIKQRLVDFVLDLKSKGYEAGDVSNGLQATEMIKWWG